MRASLNFTLPDESAAFDAAISAMAAAKSRETGRDKSAQNTTPARTGSAPYGVFSGRPAAPRRNAARQRLGDDGTGAVAHSEHARSTAPTQPRDTTSTECTVPRKCTDTLLERLRKVETGDGRGDHVVHWPRNPDGPEAADEIERLKRVIDTYCDVCRLSQKEIATLKEKIERMDSQK